MHILYKEKVMPTTFEKYFYVDDVLVGGILMGNIAKSGKLKKAVVDGLTRESFEAL